MPDIENEKILSGAIDESLLEEFDKVSLQAIGRKFRKKKLLTAFAKWWIALPTDKKRLFYNQADAEFTNIIELWVAIEKIAKKVGVKLNIPKL